MTEYRYTNPWARSTEPTEYVRTVAPIEYSGCQLFHVFPKQWDTVKNGVCIAQRCAIEGAKYAADSVSDLLFPTYHDVRDRLFSGLTL
jgi:hypothetical protein